MRLETRHTHSAKIIRQAEPDHPDFIRNRNLAERISEYWAERGHSVSLNIVNVGFFPEHRCAVHGIRSDMVNGYPTRKLKGAA